MAIALDAIREALRDADPRVRAALLQATTTATFEPCTSDTSAAPVPSPKQRSTS